MDWEKRQSVWVERQERTVGRTRVALAGVILVACCALVGFSWVGFSLPTSLWMFVFIAAVPFVLLFVVLLTCYRRFRKILFVVPQHDGLVCPRCVRPLDEEPCRCPRCKRVFVGEDVVQYWSEFAVSKMLAGRRWMEMTKTSPLLRHRLSDSVQRRSARSYPVFIICIVSVMVLLGVVQIAWLGGSAISALLQALPWILWPLGIGLLTRGWKRRMGEEWHCAGCNYVRGPGAGDYCPECGSRWNEFGGVIKGRPVSSGPQSVRNNPSMIVGGAAIVLAVLLLAARFSMNGPSVYRFVPTSSLITDVTAKRSGFRPQQWAAINQRQLDAEEKERLATALLDCRMDNGLLSRNGEAWLAKEIMSGTLSAEVRERYYREMLADLRLECPAKVRKGEEVVVRVCGKSCEGSVGSIAWNDDMHVIVGGFFVNDEEVPRGRRENVISLGLFETDGGFRGGYEYQSRLKIVPEECGPLKVRFVLWLVAEPRGWYELVWREDGSPEIGPGARWQKRLEVERVIDVVE